MDVPEVRRPRPDRVGCACRSLVLLWLPRALAEGGGRESPGRRVPFFRVAERKSPKKGRPHCLRPQRCAPGQPAVLAGRVRRRTRCAALQLRSNSCGKSVHEARVSCGTRATPPAVLLGAYRGDGERTSIRAFASLGPVSRAQAPRAGRHRWRRARPLPGSSAATTRMDVRLFGTPPLLAAPAPGRLRGGSRAGARLLRDLTRRGCPSGARSAKRVPRRTPQPPRRRSAPTHRVGVAD